MMHQKVATTCRCRTILDHLLQGFQIGVLILGHFVLVVFLILLVLLLPNQKGKRLGVLFGKIQDTLSGQSVTTRSP
jgi:hypothetical protein